MDSGRKECYLRPHISGLRRALMAPCHVAPPKGAAAEGVVGRIEVGVWSSAMLHNTTILTAIGFGDVERGAPCALCALFRPSLPGGEMRPIAIAGS